MTDPLRPDDELVSAVLDGEATPDERARVEADPVLSARLAEFAAVRDAVAEPVEPAPDAVRAQAIAAAMAARPRPSTAENVRPLRRRGRSADVPRFLAIAAGVLIVLVTFGALATVGGDDSDGGGEDAASSADAGDDATSFEDAGAAEGGEAAPADEPAYLADLQGADLGSVEDERELAQRLAATAAGGEQGDESEDGDDAFTEDTTASTPTLPQADVDSATRGGSEDCQVGLVEADAGLDGLLAQAQVDFAGQPAVVYLYGTPDGRQRVVVVTEEGCRTLAAFDL